MKKRNRLERRSRSDIGREVNDHRGKLSELEEKTVETVEDKETLGDMNDELKKAGTLEGLEHLEAGLEATEGVAQDVYEHRDGDLSVEQKDTGVFKRELQEKSDSTGQDIQKVESSEKRLHVRDTRSELGKAEAALKKDGKFLDSRIHDVQERLRRSERLRDELRNRLDT